MDLCVVLCGCVAGPREYQENIALVDSGVAELVSVIEDFYHHDGRTAYVFTSDHGMTNWGKKDPALPCVSIIYVRVCFI